MLTQGHCGNASVHVYLWPRQERIILSVYCSYTVYVYDQVWGTNSNCVFCKFVIRQKGSKRDLVMILFTASVQMNENFAVLAKEDLEV